jgi:phenylalanyl-tRNA synthetase beta chain
MDVEQDVWVAELAVEELFSHQRRPEAVSSPAAFPPAKRDLSIVVDDDTPFASIQEAIREVAGRLAGQALLIDRYTGRQIPAGRHSLTFAIEYRDPSRTLTAAEVDDLHRRIGQTLATKFNAQLR